MRIAILVNSLPPRSIGGAEIQAASTAVRLAERGHEVTVFARAVPGDTAGAELKDGVTWVRTKTAPVPGLSFFAHILAFKRDWKKHGGPQSDVILAYQLVINGVLGARVSQGKIPLVSWVRSELEIESQGLKYRRLSPWVIRNSTIVLAQTKTLAEKVRGFCKEHKVPNPKVRVLPNAIALKEEPTYDNRSGLVFLGRLVSHKGVEVLLGALKRVSSSPRLRMLGDGPLRSELQAKAKGLNVTFEGAVAPKDVSKALEGARVLVSSSWTEGFPNAILEGMERGIPIVATAVGGVTDVVEDAITGYLVKAGDEEALAAKMELLLEDDDLWESMARAARATAETYSWETHLQELENVLKDAISGT
ncbi:MAG: glycosyltransferase family 4 protein [Candidatus Eisenbacteria bacterium]|uniref:Glycosyltransferase family 4 protein n=1 Tax=Eiseniibacteriota bacterium TaxID=2212470 RepID=A0A7Y2E5M8_UNCEI|nr:glycosyltransferase family 4 protein [Candidatus Eisenbacteria bacterium]